jgi:hypothetical protein
MNVYIGTEVSQVNSWLQFDGERNKSNNVSVVE